MSRRNYKSTRNYSENLLAPKFRTSHNDYSLENKLLIDKFFTTEVKKTLTEWELTFIESVKNSKYKLTDKQVVVLNKILKKLRKPK